MASKLEVEVDMKSNAEKVWKSMRESTTLFPKALPQHYRSIQVLQGDGKSVGSVRLVNYSSGPSVASAIKERLEFVDEANKTMGYSVTDGDVLKYYKNFKRTLKVSPKGDGSSLKWCCEFEKASAEVPNPDQLRDFVIKDFNDLDAYILATT